MKKTSNLWKLIGSAILTASLLTPQTGIAQLRQYPTATSGTLYYAVYDGSVKDRIYATNSNALFVSEDAGTTWRVAWQLPQEYTNMGTITDIKTFGNNGDVVFFTITHVTTPEIAGVYSLNHKTGELKHYPTPNQIYPVTAASYDVDPQDFNRIVVHTNYMKDLIEYRTEVYLTTDGGETWETIYNYSDYNSVHISEVMFAPGNSRKIYMTRTDGPSGTSGGIFISDDSGKTWTEHLNGIVLAPIAVNPQNPDEIIVGTGNTPFIEEGLYRSFDGGETWSFFDEIEWQPFIMDNIVAINYDPVDPNIIYVLEENEIIYTDDSFKTWKNITPGSYYFGFNASINPFNTQEILTGASISTDQVMYTPDRYQTWEQLTNVGYGENAEGIAAANDGALYWLLDGALHRQASGTEEETEVPATGYTRLFKGSDDVVFLANPESKKLAFVDFAGDAQLTAIEGTAEDVKAVASDPANTGIYYVAANGTLAKADIAAKTLAAVENIPSGTVSAVANNSGTIFIGVGSKIYSSADNGATWNEKSSGLGTAGILTIAANGNTIVAATESGIYLSDDAAENWTKTALADNNVRSVAIAQGVIAAGSYADGQPAAIHYSEDNGETWRTISAKELQYAHASAIDFAFAADAITAHIASSDMGRLSYTIALQPQSAGAISQFPYNESFEKGGIPYGWENTGWTACAKNEGTPATSSDGSETKARFSSETTGGQARLITPQFDLSGLEYPTLSFDYAATSGTLKLYYQNIADGEWTEIPFSANASSDWQTAEIALPEKSATYRIAFEAESDGASDIQIDNISIYNGSAQTFNDVRNLAASIVYGPEVALTWTAPESNYKATYNVYRDNEKIVENITVNKYVDKELSTGEHTWTVKTVYGGTESQGTSITATYTGEHTPVSELTAAASNDVNGNAVASLVWSVPEGYSAGIYNVYRGEELVAQNITATAFTDTNIPNGKHTWSITAVYGDEESEAVTAEAEIVNRCAPVRNLKAGYDIDTEKVTLTWEEPCDLPADYISQASTPVQGIGYKQEGEWRMTIAVRWSAAELQEMGLDGAKITEIALVPWSQKGKYYPKVWTGGDGDNAGKEAIVNVTRDGYSMNVREWNSIPLNTPITINAKEELWIGYQVNFTGFDDVIGCDAGPEKQGVNKVFDGTNWWNASDFDPAYTANFCIAARIETADGKMMLKRLKAPEESISYNVYRNDELLTNTTETSYEDSDMPAEDYYTYSVTAVHGLKGESAARSAELFAGNLCPEAENVTATAEAATGDVTITWDAAEPYYIEEATFTESFDNGVPETWTLLDKDGDGNNWQDSELPNTTSMNYPADPLSGKCVISVTTSIVTNPDDPLNPIVTYADNWLISPAITLTQDKAKLIYNVAQLYWASWETYYEVMISTTGTDYEDFTPIFEEKLGQATDPEHALWFERSIDLSEYAGQTFHIAFHHKCLDPNQPSEGLQLDEMSIVETVPVERKYNIYRDGEPLAGDVTGTSYTDTEAADGQHEYSVMTMCEDLGYESHPNSATTTVGGINGITTGSISVYPNPATDFIRIDNGGNAIGTVRLVDMSGRTVGEYDFKAENTATIDVSTLEKGVYFLITDNGKLKVIKR